jgi:hypothetical protein
VQTSSHQCNRERNWCFTKFKTEDKRLWKIPAFGRKENCFYHHERTFSDFVRWPCQSNWFTLFSTLKYKMKKKLLTGSKNTGFFYTTVRRHTPGTDTHQLLGRLRGGWCKSQNFPTTTNGAPAPTVYRQQRTCQQSCVQIEQKIVDNITEYLVEVVFDGEIVDAIAAARQQPR